MSDEASVLGALRQRIDQLDEQIQELINERAECAKQVAEVKLRDKSETDAVFYRPEREAQVLRRVMERNRGPLSNEEMARLFREIMSACLALEKPLRISFLGPAGTFTQAAALKHFGHSVNTAPVATIAEVFREVEAGAAQYGVAPIENSTEGMINHTLDMFLTSPLKICGEVQLRIHHHLLVGPGMDMSKVNRIYSHQQSLGQCRQWLDAHWPTIERVAVSSNAEAARRAAKEQDSAAIAGDMAAEQYGLTAVARNIEDRPDNTTRFLIVGRERVGRSGHDKTSILVSTKNRPGALYSLLEPFHRLGISLTRIETRPSPTGAWTYVFFIDFEGHVDDPFVQQALQEISGNAVELKLLGSYPLGVL